MDNEIKNTETMDAIVTSENVNKEDEEDETYVDLSNSGLTIVPATLFKKHEITKLDLSQNNIRNLPQEICQCINLKSLNLSKNGFRCTNENDTVILPKTLIKLVNLEYLNLAECSLMAIPNIVWTLTTLKYLDLSRNKIMVLSGSVGNLDNLVWLSCQHAGLSGIPLEIVGCRKLEILLLYGNQITEQLPTVLSDLPNLKEMAVNIRDMSDNFTNQKKTESQPDDDQSASVNDDNDDDVNTQALLKSGQIRSEHISATLFQLPALKPHHNDNTQSISNDQSYCRKQINKPIKFENDEICVICWEVLQNYIIKGKECLNHSCCQKCYEIWRQKSFKCPKCRTQITYLLLYMRNLVEYQDIFMHELDWSKLNDPIVSIDFSFDSNEDYGLWRYE